MFEQTKSIASTYYGKSNAYAITFGFMACTTTRLSNQSILSGDGFEVFRKQFPPPSESDD